MLMCLYIVVMCVYHSKIEHYQIYILNIYLNWFLFTYLEVLSGRIQNSSNKLKIKN